MKLRSGQGVVLVMLGLAIFAALFKLITTTSINARIQERKSAMSDVRLMTLDPGHFHAALVHKEMYPGVARRVDVYAPLGFDLTEHLDRIARFNLRPDKPTSWQLEIHAGPDYFERMLNDKPGNVVVISGRNKGKGRRISASVEGGINVLADKPWVITAAEFPDLESALETADRKGLVVYDIMTERFEITTILQRELIHDSAVFGNVLPGTADDPGVSMTSVHHILKLVAGVPNRRPGWFFDVNEQGEGMADVGTHLIDLVQWMLFPDQAIDYRKDISVHGARHWPTVLTRSEYQRVTGEDQFPAYLKSNVRGDLFDYFCNGSVDYSVRGINAKVVAEWKYETPEGGSDTHFASFKGTRSRIEIRQGKEERYIPELYVFPTADRAAVLSALKQRVSELQKSFPRIGIEEQGAALRITIPDNFRVGHEAHFGQVTGKFLGYLKDRSTLPSWERPNMLSKYYVTTRAVELSNAATTIRH
jgi:predicted dehydrogenase